MTVLFLKQNPSTDDVAEDTVLDRGAFFSFGANTQIRIQAYLNRDVTPPDHWMAIAESQSPMLPSSSHIEQHTFPSHFRVQLEQSAEREPPDVHELAELP